MDEAGLGVDYKEEVAWWGEGYVAEGDVPVVGDGAGGGKAVVG